LMMLIGVKNVNAITIIIVLEYLKS
jgi:hypothetical protein